MSRALLSALAALLLLPSAASAQLDAKIARTDHGIPHITADDFASLGYGYGYALAEDNVCVIADQYVTVRGERSRFFGADGAWSMRSNGTTQTNVNSDFFYKKIIAQGTIEKLIAQPAPNGPRPEVQEAVRGYVEGYNRYLRDVGVANLPDPACKGADWVRPIEEIDAYRRFYQLALLASSGVAIDGIGGAQPPTPPVGAGGGSSGGPTAEQIEQLGERLPLGGIGSNAYGIGRDQTDNGKGMLLGNPHFPWDGSERFYQAHLTIPGKMDVSGGSLFGVPVVLIGHTRGLAWSHTVSTAFRFTPFELKLVPGSPTTYLVDGEPRQMTPTELTVEVKTAGGALEERKRVLWDTEYGPIFTSLLGLPAFPWTPGTAFALGDANAANFRYLNHFYETNLAQSVREYDQVIRRNQGIPWVNSIAADSTGEAYYADISVVPHVTDEQAERCNTAVGTATFAALRLPTLDGSRADCNWGRDPSAVQPGTFGPQEHLPSMFRSDYTMNANDSYWLGNLKQRLEGFPLIVGNERSARSLRTRIGLLMVDGERFTLRKLQDTVFNNRQYAGELWMPEVLQLCDSDPSLAAPCAALRKWDVHDDLTSQGALLFRRFAQRLNVGSSATSTAGPAPFEVPYDNADPANTPRGLNEQDPRVAQALRDAASELEGLGIPLDAPLGDVQAEVREGERIPIHGGPGTAGVFNAINVGNPGEGGITTVPHGSSFVQAVQFVAGACPVDPRTILTYSQSTNATSPWFSDQTRMFARKEWNSPPFCAGDVERETIATTRLTTAQEQGGGRPETCTSPAGFRRLAIQRRKRGIGFRWATRAGGAVRVDVFRVSRGNRLVGSRRVASYTGKPDDDGANFGGAKLRGAGVFVARFRTRGVIGGTDTRRLAFRRSRSGAFTRLPKFEANSGCGLLRSFRLGAPVFGRTGVSAAFTLAENASYELRRGARVLRRGQGRSGRLRITSARRGRVVLRLVVRSGGRTITTKLAAARL